MGRVCINRPAEPYNTFVPCFSGVTVLWHKMDTLIYAMNRLILECLYILYTADLSYALEPCVNAIHWYFPYIQQ